MARPERPINPDWPLAGFAGGLRVLRRQRDITYREMARLTNYGVTVLSVAAGGLTLPTLDVTVAYVGACGGPVVEWRYRWAEARGLIDVYGVGVDRG
jgi:hypothetical protein